MKSDKRIISEFYGFNIDLLKTEMEARNIKPSLIAHATCLHESVINDFLSNRDRHLPGNQQFKKIEEWFMHNKFINCLAKKNA